MADPTGKVATYRSDDPGTPVTHPSTGVYGYAIDTTAKPGRWQYRWWSPAGGSVQTAGRGFFFVDPFPSPTP